ncbi:hypothetical protein SAMN05660484_01167 [Eubacterium ruminantium]|uniref:Uncharacterized protein n=1 Tax=Eubacterium ruminantium TaxID=42322 RepID=A0A1T4MDR5_9FIRM|nr:MULTISPECIES: hypothetical protein [Eubacterium]MCR5369069.1 hypothetical protein [Eubacterium sp.]SCW47246.1 hypothetical protein SAMN05660484_01167 [Eubacterium ruminantium]SDM54551.1 hypothetical protein SAMN04490370_10438 [Eubacterium ruminantium]SJZ64996.1 hypothetical protein SAMN02745110_01167 [Eubacterium ruminantium]
MADEIVRFDELPSIKRGYIEGLKYYYSIIQLNQKSIAEYKDISQSIKQFGYELEKLNQNANAASVEALSIINEDFYPNGKMHSVFKALKLEVALDGISECLMYLKKKTY